MRNTFKSGKTMDVHDKIIEETLLALLEVRIQPFCMCDRSISSSLFCAHS